MVIDIRNLQDRVNIDEAKVRSCAKRALIDMGEEGVELSILFVNDAYIKRLNSKYRDTDSKTDVLAFSMRQGEGISQHSEILGDVVISTQTARREAVRRKEPVQKELDLYLVHGILHLLGYDDEKPGDRKKMRAKEKELLGEM
ncbi:MAG: rRNA maturation RNase YbeY [Candidatus Omnitrophica bacterium]|nr:rRNA maturation RNase YbeY [Candidatus Omnitrophota bacterium]